MNRIKRLVVGAAVGLSLVAGTLVGAAPAAQANPGGCYTWNSTAWYGNNQGNSTCTYGSGGLRNVTWFVSGFNGQNYVRYGPWVSAGQTSTTTASGWTDYKSSQYTETRA